MCCQAWALLVFFSSLISWGAVIARLGLQRWMEELRGMFRHRGGVERLTDRAANSSQCMRKPLSIASLHLPLLFALPRAGGGHGGQTWATVWSLEGTVTICEFTQTQTTAATPPCRVITRGKWVDAWYKHVHCVNWFDISQRAEVGGTNSNRGSRRAKHFWLGLGVRPHSITWTGLTPRRNSSLGWKLNPWSSLLQSAWWWQNSAHLACRVSRAKSDNACENIS